MNKLDEKAFLCNRVKELMTTMASPQELREQKIAAYILSDRLALNKKANIDLADSMKHNERTFVLHVLMEFDKHLKMSTEMKDSKLRKGLLNLGKWNFLLDWLADRKDEEPILKELYNQISENVGLN
jgi:hypothetical protein